jgi:hypothetical protein
VLNRQRRSGQVGTIHCGRGLRIEIEGERQHDSSCIPNCLDQTLVSCAWPAADGRLLELEQQKVKGDHLRASLVQAVNRFSKYAPGQRPAAEHFDAVVVDRNEGNISARGDRAAPGKPPIKGLALE